MSFSSFPTAALASATVSESSESQVDGSRNRGRQARLISSGNRPVGTSPTQDDRSKRSVQDIAATRMGNRDLKQMHALRLNSPERVV